MVCGEGGAGDGPQEKMGQICNERRAALGPAEEGRRELESLVLWEQKTVRRAPCALFPQVKWQWWPPGGRFAGSICPALTVSPGKVASGRAFNGAAPAPLQLTTAGCPDVSIF